jgi:hypothetical protein
MVDAEDDISPPILIEMEDFWKREVAHFRPLPMTLLREIMER